MADPYRSIRDGPTGGAELLEKAFTQFAREIPGDVFADHVDTWTAWGKLEERLAAVFVAGPLVTVAQAGAVRALDLAPLQQVELRSVDFDPEIARRLAAEWAEIYGGKLVTAETTKTRAAIGRLIAEGLRGTIAQRDVARQIIAIRGFGLDDYRQRQLERKVATWIADSNVNARTVRRRARKLTKKLRLRRAFDIWGFEKRSAIQEGARLAWSEAQRRGHLSAERKIFWRHPGGGGKGHPCPRCGALIGVAVGIQESFTSRTIEGGGKRFNGRQIVRRRPPEHGKCDCFLEVE